MHDKIEHPILGTIAVEIHRGNKRIYLRCSGNGLKLTLPSKSSLETGLRFIDGNMPLIMKMKERYEQKNANFQTDPARIVSLRKQAENEFPERLRELADKYGFSYKKCTIRNSRTRWGSCSMNGNINLSLYLASLPAHLQEYVMLHELCHTRQMNHSSEFWAEVEKYLPNYKSLRKELKSHHCC